jgi:hypothetical protein
MSSRSLLAVCAAARALVLAACGSAGVRLENPEKTDSSAPPATSAPPPSPSWTPPDYGTAQPAVQAYLAMVDAFHQALRDPAHADTAAFDKYLTGQAKGLFDGSISSEQASKLAYRGTFPEDRVTVTKNDVTNPVLPEVTLRDCPALNDSWVQYDTTTGQAVQVETSDPPPPYANSVQLFLLRNQWTVTEFSADVSRTCTP